MIYLFSSCLQSMEREPICHRPMGPRHHSLDAVISLNTYKVIFLSLFYFFLIVSLDCFCLLVIFHFILTCLFCLMTGS